MMALVVCFLDGEELVSFLFDIFHDIAANMGDIN